MAVLGALGDLVLSLSADTARFQSDLGRADRLAKKFSREVGQALGNLAGALVALGGASGIGALVKGQIDAADAALRLSQQLGITTEQWSQYVVQAKLADVSQESLTVGLRQLSKNQADFVAGTGEAAQAFRALGIEQKDVIALNGDTAALFELVIGKLAPMRDDLNKTALEVKLFGRSGNELRTLINGFAETRNEARELNAIIGKDTAEAADRFNDNLTRVGIAVQAIGLNIAREILPTLEKMSEKMVSAAKDTASMGNAGRIADAGLKILATAGTAVATIFSAVGTSVGAAVAVIAAVARGEFRSALEIARENTVNLAEQVAAAVLSIEKTWDDTASKIKGKSEDTGKKLAAPALVAADAIEKANKQLAAISKRQAGIFGDIAAQLKEIQKEQQRVTDSFVESAQIATEAADGMVFTWDEFGNRVEMTREEFDVLENSNKRLFDGIGSAAAEGFGAVIFGADKASDAVARLGARLADLIAEETILKPLSKGISGGLKGFSLSGLFGIGGDVGVAEEAAALGIPSFDSGTDRVPRTGLALVHEGERITPAGQNTGGGITVVNNNYIDARADQASIQMMLERNRRQTVADIAAIQSRRGDSRIG